MGREGDVVSEAAGGRLERDVVQVDGDALINYDVDINVLLSLHLSSAVGWNWRRDSWSWSGSRVERYCRGLW